MEQTMTPSAMTDGQIDKAVDMYRAMLRKHRSELGSDAVQHALGQPGYVAEQVAVLRKYAEAASSMLIRHVTVDRTRTPMEAIDATGRAKYLTDSVVATMPRGESDEADVVFFKLGRNVSDADLEKEYDLRGLKPADPYSLAAVNEADPAFADQHPNGTPWKDADGNWCYAAFYRWNDERYVGVSRGGDDWDDYWWFAGLKIPAAESNSVIIRVDRSIRPIYPDWMKAVMHPPELEATGPSEYDLSKVELWFHEGQKNGQWIEGNKIYEHLKNNKMLESCLSLRDGEEIQKKGLATFRKFFGGKAVFLWKSVVQRRLGSLYVPYLIEGDGQVVVLWLWLGHDWGGVDPALRFAS